MGKIVAKVLDIDGKFREMPDFPVAVVREAWESEDGNVGAGQIVDPIFNHQVYNNLYGRIMTLLEATTDSHKLKPVKDIFSKELMSWQEDVHSSARGVINSQNGSVDTSNIYLKSYVPEVR